MLLLSFSGSYHAGGMAPRLDCVFFLGIQIILRPPQAAGAQGSMDICHTIGPVWGLGLPEGFLRLDLGLSGGDADITQMCVG